MKKKLLFSILFSLICIFYARAQVVSVSGVVTSAEDQSTMPGVTIQIKGTTSGTITDFNGAYSLQTEANSVLIFSSVGFETMEIPLRGRTRLDVVLNPDAQSLEGVVVTALGISRQKRELGYATEEVSGDVVARSGAGSVISALSGRSAGVQIINPTGVDGSSSRIVIRGNNSLSENNQPLIVVDGVPMSNESGMTGFNGRDWGTALNNINQEDIEDINILKGPTAAALYGARGGNGVVLITTKKGSRQKGLGISYTVSYKMTTPYLFRDVQNKYGAGGPLSFEKPTLQTNDDGVYVYPGIYNSSDGPENGEPTNTTFGYYGSSVSWGPEMDGTEVLWWDGVMRSYSPQPDNLSMLFNNGNALTNNISFSNAGEFGSVRVSLTDSRSNAIIDNCKLSQTTVNVGATLNVSKKIKADVSVSYMDYNRLNSPELGESYSNFCKGLLYGWPRSWKGLEAQTYENEDGTMYDWSEYSYSTYFPYMNYNTFWSFYNNNTTLDRSKFLGSLRLTYDITDWLTLAGKAGVDFSLDKWRTTNKPTEADGVSGGSYSSSMGKYYTIDADFLLTAHKKNIFDSKLSASISGGAERLYRNDYSMGASSGSNWVYPYLYTFYNYNTVTSSLLPSESYYEKQVNSVYGFLNLGYDDYLFLDVTGRNDWSSTLPSSNNSYFYPSVSLSFIPTEAFNAAWGPVTFLKFRGSFAMTASDDDPYKLDFSYDRGTFANQVTASFPYTVPPLELKPQRQRSYEAGFNIEFMEKVNFDFSYYYIYAYDQIIQAPMAASSGAGSVKTNSGIITNAGIEGIIDYKVLQKKDLFLEIGLNFARNRNKIVSLGGFDMFELASLWGSNGPTIAVTEGEYYGTIYGWDYVYSYIDESGTTVGPFYDDKGNALPLLNDEGTEYLITDSKVAVGNSAPWLTGGVTFRLGWKDFTLSGLIDAKLGGDIYCGSYVISMQTGQSPETLYERDGNGLPYYDKDGNFLGNYGVILPGVHSDGTVNETVVHYYYKYLPNMGGWGHTLTTPGILENTWIKMRELSLSYKLPQKLLDKQKFFQSFEIALVGRDLFYFYKSLPDDINPEGTLGSGNAQGLEYASYPGTRSFMLTLKMSL
ncbi:MAG: SusC/RagA family TonB-linked outer membrane protein [Bacteroidales bacterium]|nr:SusC/RagA family TonB-linked outer membrane protein [Bacteroidales bacterium]